jgi:hypothetical protein
MNASPNPASAPSEPFGEWTRRLALLYESDAATQFVLHGNTEDRFPLPNKEPSTGSLLDFLSGTLLASFQVVITYDLGNGIRVEKGHSEFQRWPHHHTLQDIPRDPLSAVQVLTHYFRYLANLLAMGGTAPQVACIIQSAHLVAPAVRGGYSFELNAVALLVREWTTDSAVSRLPLASFLVTENLNELHPLIVNNTRAAHVEIPLPGPALLLRQMRSWRTRFPKALSELAGREESAAAQLAGAALSSIESLFKQREHTGQPITANDLAQLKKELVEKDCNGLIEFVQSKLTLDALSGMEGIKAWLRQDIRLWNQGDLQALPMGYLLCGPVGTGKTFTVKCLAGEAGVPVVVMKNFRDRWVGSTEGNLERIFRLLHALGRCIVFVDEADQTLGRRDGGQGDGGISGRVYSMVAQEMSNPEHRGRLLWILATSRPDLVEVDLKRPGRVDIKIPIFPAVEPLEVWNLLRALAVRKGVTLPEECPTECRAALPELLTPGTAEALAMKLYRRLRTGDEQPVDALAGIFADFRQPIPAEQMDFQMRLAIDEASDMDFVPVMVRERYGIPGR